MINIQMSGLFIEKETKVYHTGFEICKPSYSFGPFVRDHYLIHFVKSGQGIFKINNEENVVKKDMAFLIYPNQLTYYQADDLNPWSYHWIGFQGEKVPSMLSKTMFNKNQIIDLSHNFEVYEALENIHKLDSASPKFEFKQMSYFYDLFAGLTSNDFNNTTEWYADEAVKYINMNYSRNISIGNIAKHLNIDRSYFSRVFKSIYDVSPQEYLINFRIEKAKFLLQTGNYRVSEVAISLGYTDPYVFAKAFKKSVGVSPQKYKTQNIAPKIMK